MLGPPAPVRALEVLGILRRSALQDTKFQARACLEQLQHRNNIIITYCHARSLCNLCIMSVCIWDTEINSIIPLPNKRVNKTADLYHASRMRSAFRCGCDIVGIERFIAALVRTAKTYRSYNPEKSNQTDQYMMFIVDKKRAWFHSSMFPSPNTSRAVMSPISTICSPGFT